MMARKIIAALLASGLLAAAPAQAGLIKAILGKPKIDPHVEFAPTLPEPLRAPPANGAIFQASYGYAPLTSGARAASVGDVITILLVEKTQAVKSNSASTNRTGSVGLTPPTTGIFSLFKPSSASASGGGKFDGTGAAQQSNQLDGAITVTIQSVLPNGNLVVRGEKQLTLNRGDEQIHIAGIVRPGDIAADNTVPSTRVADARIAYAGTGEIARASRQGWLSKFFSMLSPF